MEAKLTFKILLRIKPEMNNQMKDICDVHFMEYPNVSSFIRAAIRDKLISMENHPPDLTVAAASRRRAAESSPDGTATPSGE